MFVKVFVLVLVFSAFVRVCDSVCVSFMFVFVFGLCLFLCV